MRSIVSGDDGEVEEGTQETGDPHQEDIYNYDPSKELMEDSFPEELKAVPRQVHEPLDMPHGLDKESFSQDNVIGMPGIASTVSEVVFMQPRSFEEMPEAIQALRERRTIILNLTQMDPKEAQRSVDFVSGGNFAIDGSQERLGESIFLFAPSCVKVTLADSLKTAPSTPAAAPPQPSAEESSSPQPADKRSFRNGSNGHGGLPSAFTPDMDLGPFSGELPPDPN